MIDLGRAFAKGVRKIAELEAGNIGCGVEAEWGLSDNNRKAKYYKLTNEGRRYLRSETKTWEAYAQAVAKILSATAPHTPETS